MGESISHLQGWRLGSEFFNALVAPDATGLLLRWLADPEAFKQTRQNLTGGGDAWVKLDGVKQKLKSIALTDLSGAD